MLHQMAAGGREVLSGHDFKKLYDIIARHEIGQDAQFLFTKIVESFNSGIASKGLPLGNLTSQLLVNVYMNEFDQYLKHVLKVKYYIRFADDFVVMSNDKNYLENILDKIILYLHENLLLKLHPNKVSIKTFSSGVDFLGWVHFPYHRTLRTSTKRRMMKNLKGKPKPTTIASYKGMLKHGNTYKLQQRLAF